MSDLYQQQRRLVIAITPIFEPLLPVNPPEGPSQVPPSSLQQRYSWLKEAANTHAQLVMVVGWGDGSLIRNILDDALLAQKDVWILLLEGETDAFATSLCRPIIEDMGRCKVGMSYIRSEADVDNAVAARFGPHYSIPPLAGMDRIDSHPLAPAAQMLRARLLPHLLKSLIDRPQAYGNDITDTFTGLYQASRNAPKLLRSPSLDDLAGFFGNTPIISIAAGPSLKRHLPKLRELQDRCILVACDALLHGLLDEGIVPHFCTPIERVTQILPMLTRAKESRTIFAGIPVVLPEIVEGFGDRLTCIHGGDELYYWLDPDHHSELMTGSSTGVLSIAVGMAISTGPMYLVGHDLARDETGSHWGGAAQASSDWKQGAKDTQANRSVGSYSGYDVRLVPGNGGGTVPSIIWWDRFRQEISLIAFRYRHSGRVIYNVNAHDGIGAVIPNTEAAPLPDPASLPRLDWPTLPAGKPERYTNWAKRASRLVEDGRAFLEHVRSLHDEIEAMKRRPPGSWQVAAIAEKLTTSAKVSEGNRQAFSYFLRSALHNSTAIYHQRRRTPSRTAKEWHGLCSMATLCEGLDKAVTILEPGLKEIAEDYANG